MLYKELRSLSELSEHEKGPGCIVVKNAKLSLGEKCSAKVKSKYPNFASDLKNIEEAVSYSKSHFKGHQHSLNEYLQIADILLGLHHLRVSVCHAFYNVAIDVAVLIFGVWKARRPFLIFGLLNPALKIAAFAIEATEKGTGQHFANGINLMVMYPTADSAVVSQDVVAAAHEGSLGQYLKYIFGTVYLILLKRRLQNLRLSHANPTKKIGLTFSAVVKPKVVYPEWFLHSCLYGHKGRIKSIILAFADIDINQVSEFPGIL